MKHTEDIYLGLKMQIAQLVLYRTRNEDWLFEEELELVDLEIDALENLAEVQLAKLAFYAQEEGMLDADNIEEDEEYKNMSKKDFKNMSKKDFIKLLLDNAAEDIKEGGMSQKDVDTFINDIYETLQTQNQLSDEEKDELFNMFLESLEEEYQPKHACGCGCDKDCF